MPRLRAFAVIALLALAAVVAETQERRAPPLPAAAADAEPWPADVVSTLRTYFERFDIDEVMVDLRRPEQPAAAGSFLGADFLAPFRWVQQAVGFDPYYGSLRGTTGTELSRGGNSLDRSLLLAQLYRDRGIETRLVRGTLAWRDAERLALPAGVGSRYVGDPGLRLVELTADHWWIEARRDGGWMALDTSMPGLAPGDAPARGGRRLDGGRLPPDLLATVRVEVLLGEQQLLALERASGDLAGRPLRLAALTRRQMAAQLPVAVDLPPGQPEPGTPAPAPVDPVAEAIPAYPGDAVTLRLHMPDGVRDIGPVPVERLPSLRMRVRVQPPLGLPSEVTMQWGSDPASVLIVRLEPGNVGGDRLGEVALPVYRALRRLADAEREAQAAYVARPPDALVTGDVALPIPPPADLEGGLEPGVAVADADAPLDAWTALHVAVIAAWTDLADAVLDATAVSALAAADLLTPSAEVARPGVRLLGLHWRPPTANAAGGITLWLDAPVIVGGGSPLGRELQTAHGLLSSAMLGQVLNRVADRPPIGAFDVTLRAVGTGSRLSWWRGRGPEAPPWPEAGAAAARDDLRRGLVVAGPAEPLTVSDPPLLGWWAWEPDSGAIAGRVLGGLGTSQASVSFGEPVDLGDLDSALASTATLHDAARWLVLAADAERPELRELLPRACAATALVRDLLLAGAPDGWRDPQFARYCGGR